MDDYISKTEAFDIVRFECGEWSGLAKTIGKRFDDLPHADVQPVVRCKDCKHRHLDGMIWNCPFGLSGGEGFFCAYGAKDGEQNETD